MDKFSLSEIGEYFRGKSLLITGSTGFLGKVLLVKLLQSCPDVAVIYILLRDRPNFPAEHRRDEILKDKIFDGIKASNEQLLNKVQHVRGDIALDGLGLSKGDSELLQKNVSIVIHSAATVRFNAPLRESVNLNILGTRRVLRLCKTLPQLEAFLHISTAYANCDQDTIQEMIYEPKMSPQAMVDLVDSASDDLLQVILPRLLGKLPNSYTLTKALAEVLIEKEHGDLPTTILRPSVIGPALKEPYPGWVDHLNGVVGLAYSIEKGFLRTMLTRDERIIDLIPVDFVANMVITAAWNQGTKGKESEVHVVNCISGSVNPLPIGSMIEQIVRWIKVYPDPSAIRFPRFSGSSSIVSKNLVTILDQYLPCFVIDMLSLFLGHRPMLLKACAKTRKMVEAMEFFSTREWTFTSDNLISLEKSMNPVDREIFYFDVKRIRWADYLEKYVLGIRKFLIKEDLTSLLQARLSIQRKLWLERGLQAFLCLAVISIGLWIF